MLPDAATGKSARSTFCGSLGGLWGLPGSGFGAGEDGVADGLGFLGVGEGGAGGGAAVETGDEVGDLVDEGVFVADVESGDPPVFHIRLVAAVVGDMNVSPTA